MKKTFNHGWSQMDTDLKGTRNLFCPAARLTPGSEKIVPISEIRVTSSPASVSIRFCPRWLTGPWLNLSVTL